MPTVIDSLVVTLGLDPANFTKGQKQAAEALLKTRQEASRTAKEMQADGDRAAEFFTKAKIEALSFIGVLLGGKGIEAFTRDQTRSLADLGRQARNIGEAAPAVEAFAMAIQRMGGNAESARGVLQTFAQQRAEFVNFGRGNFGPEMALIGGNLNTKPLEAIQLFQAYIQRMKDSADGIQKINLIGKDVFGFDQATTNALIQMATVVKLNQEIGKSYHLGTPTPEMIERATRFQAAMTALGQAATYDGQVLLDDMYPALTKVVDVLTAMIDKNPTALLGISAIAGVLTVISTLSLTRVTAELLGFTRAATMLGGIASLLGRLGLLGAALTTTYEGFHIGGLNEGESAELQRLRAAHNMAPDGSGGSPGTGPGGPALAPDVEIEVRKRAAEYGLDPDHMVRLAQVEHGGYNNVSPAGAFGPMQLMPATGALVGVSQNDSWQKNVWGGTHYYATLLRMFKGNYAAADAAYNAGPGNAGVRRFAETGDPSGLPAETRKYIAKIDGIGGPKISLHSPIAPPPPRLPAPVAPSSSGAPPQASHNMTVGSVTIHTQATDAKSIARDFTGAMVAQANRGLA